MSLDIRIGCGVGVWHQGQARLCEADGANLVMDAKIDWPDGGRVARAPERQVTPFTLLNRPDLSVLVKPIRARLIGERYPDRKNAVFASLIARLMDSGNHEAQAIVDRTVRAPGEISHLAIAPRARFDDLAQ